MPDEQPMRGRRMSDEFDDEQDVLQDAPHCCWSGEFDPCDPYCLRECEYRIECRQIQEKQKEKTNAE